MKCLTTRQETKKTIITTGQPLNTCFHPNRDAREPIKIIHQIIAGQNISIRHLHTPFESVRCQKVNQLLEIKAKRGDSKYLQFLRSVRGFPHFPGPVKCPKSCTQHQQLSLFVAERVQPTINKV